MTFAGGVINFYLLQQRVVSSAITLAFSFYLAMSQTCTRCAAGRLKQTDEGRLVRGGGMRLRLSERPWNLWAQIDCKCIKCMPVEVGAGKERKAGTGRETGRESARELGRETGRESPLVVADSRQSCGQSWKFKVGFGAGSERGINIKICQKAFNGKLQNALWGSITHSSCHLRQCDEQRLSV